MHADINPNVKNKKKDEKGSESKKANESAKRKSGADEKKSPKTSVEDSGKLITDDDKDSIETLEDLKANNGEKGAESELERPSKTRKLVNFDGDKNI